MELPNQEDYLSCFGAFGSGMTPGAERHYLKQVVESEGFDVDYIPLDAGNLIRPVPLMDKDYDPYGERRYLDILTGKAVELYNSENPSNQIKRPHIAKVNSGPSCFTYYITFTAKDATGKRRTYQTKVGAKCVVENSNILFCRLKPKKKALSDSSDDDGAEKEMKTSSSAKGKENQSANTGGCSSAASSSPHPAPEEAAEPLKNTGMGGQGEGTAHN